MSKIISLLLPIKHIAVLLLHLVERNFSFIFLLFLLNILTLVYADSINNALHLSRYICFTIILITGLTELISNKHWKTYIQRGIICLSIVAFVFNCYFAYFYQGLPDEAIYEILIATNPGEIVGYIKSNLLNPWIYVCLLVGSAICIWLYKKLIKIKTPRFLLYMISAWILFSLLYIIPKIIKEPFRQPTGLFPYLACHGNNILSIGFLAYEASNNMKTCEKMFKQGNTKPTLTKNNSTIPYVVYILGESTARRHMSLYGYPLKTTPYLDKIEEQGDLVKFTDVVSPNGHTMAVLSKLFNFYRQGAKGNWYEYTDLFSVLNQAGYHTAWLSNQEYAGIYGNNGRLYAERCNEQAFTRIRGSQNSQIKDPYDSALLPLLDTFLKNKQHKKNFIVLHLMGTHAKYNDRYPSTFQAFKAEQEQGESNKVRQTRAEYDTAIRYNDSIVNAIINRFKGKNALIIYTSDHGEDVFEINKNTADHGDISINNNMVEIPMCVYMSKTFQTKHTNLTKRIRQSANRPFMTDDMIHSILDLMEIQTKEYNPTLSIFNARFNSKRVRYCYNKRYPIKK